VGKVTRTIIRAGFDLPWENDFSHFVSVRGGKRNFLCATVYPNEQSGEQATSPLAFPSANAAMQHRSLR
jgi:hypothetical protein